MANADELTAKNYTILKEEDVPGAKLTKKPENCIVEELKRWLECHGLKKSGRKQELVKRVEDALKMNLPVTPKVDGGRWYKIKLDKSKEGQQATSSSSADNTTTERPTDGWRDFPSRNLPANFNYGHVYFYLVESISTAAGVPDDSDDPDDDNLYDNCDTVTAKPLRKGRNLLNSEGYIENIHDNYNQAKEEYYIRAHVHDSMKGSEYPLNVALTFSNVSGSIKSGTCDCKASALSRCAHVSALLLYLSDKASSNELLIQPSTSKECPWDKGKKREKDPGKLHEAVHPSSKRRPPCELYYFDPRPENQRTVPEEARRNFIIELQTDEQPSMWESVLYIKYGDWKLDDPDKAIYQHLVSQFCAEFSKKNDAILDSKICCEVPGTQDQAKSKEWHNQRRFRITASKCQSAMNLGENLSKYDNLRPHFNYLHKNFWFPTSFCNKYMIYGIDNEINALREYSQRMNVLVGISGLWINKKYLHLAASPDGLIFSDGNLANIVEVKCLNILRLYSVMNVVKGECEKGQVNRQCFNVIDEKLVLKKTHSYYFQIQLQLLVTEANFCDFVLYAKQGPSSVERIFPDADLQQRIVDSTKLFWEKVFIPEYFLMRVPRDLLPFVFDSDMIL